MAVCSLLGVLKITRYLKMKIKYLLDGDGKETWVFVKFAAGNGFVTVKDPLTYLRERTGPKLVLRRIVRPPRQTVLLEACHSPKIIFGHSGPQPGKEEQEIGEIERVLKVNGL